MHPTAIVDYEEVSDFRKEDRQVYFKYKTKSMLGYIKAFLDV